MILKRSDIFFIVPARTKKGVLKKIRELNGLGYPYIIICAEKLNLPNVIYRKKLGKYDAINYGSKYVHQNTKIICLNDVDTKIYNFENALKEIMRKNIYLTYCRLAVPKGPQIYFYSLMDTIRNKFPITSSGELMLIKKQVFDKLIPLPPCKSEDNYISFKLNELNYKYSFCKECYIITVRTSTLKEEEKYKTRTVTGIYQALSLTNPHFTIKLFYIILPFISPLLLVHGGRGLSWMKGIIQGFCNYLIGDKSGVF